ncbi:MAG TPA: flagellar basal body L-ring protein FlgH [Gammaproteobacteria bacterium]|nr:flagellar basal body L-ring protein FlgH [Gammaproteobacteria bacterium]
MKHHLLLKSGLLVSSLFLTACGSIQEKPAENYTATNPVSTMTAVSASGSIYNTQSALSLFEDHKAGRIGDILTIVLQEDTKAKKNAETSLNKSTSIDTGMPKLFGRPATINGTEVLSFNVESDTEFEGKGDSQQSNQLSGTISVTVYGVFPNGNLQVRGQKFVKLNQGEEYIQISGIVRPSDIGANNQVLSTQVADARITYSGTGAVADSNSAGWLTRFFVSAIWPF